MQDGSGNNTKDNKDNYNSNNANFNFNQMKEDSKNVKESLLNLQKILASTKLGESLLNKTLLIEYKHLQKFCPSGVYILPQFDDIKVWHGVIFIREGPYKDGIFKFEVNIPTSYPAKPPEVKFTSKVIHPLVNISTGKLDLSKKFPTWEACKNFIVKVIYFIHEIFHNSVYLQETSSYNSDLAKLSLENPELFENEVSKVSKKSFEDRFDNKNTSSSLKFSEFNKYHQLILDKILKQNKEVNTYDRIEDFKNWFMNNFMEIIQNNETKKN